MGVYFTIALRNLLQARRRTLFLSTALALVTLLLVLLMGLSRGVTENMIRSATTLSAGHINVSGFYKSTPSDARPIITGTDELRRVVEEVTPGLALVIDRHRGWCKIVSETGSIQAGLSGVVMAHEPRLLDVIQLAPEAEYREGGRPEVLGDPSKLSQPGTAMLFANQARSLGVTVGDAVTLTTETLRGERNTADVTVVAVAQDLGLLSNWTVFVPKQTILDLYQLRPDTSGAVMVYLEDIDQAEATMGLLRREFAARGYEVMDHDPQPFFAKFDVVAGEDWTGQRLDLTTWKDEVAFLTWVVVALDSISFFFIAVLVVIIVIGIMNTMIIAVRERTGELGTLRAIGMRRGQVLWMVMLEALILGAGASALGAGVGTALALAVDAAAIPVPVDAVRAILLSDTIRLAIEPTSVVWAVLGFTALTALAALLPALQAARLQPVTAIQHVD